MSSVEPLEEIPQAEVRCRRCEAANLQRDKFCAECGCSLWEPCLQCGVVRSVAESESPANGSVAAIDVGCDATNIVVSSPYGLWYRVCGVAGQTFSRALVQKLNLSLAKAEQQKRAPESVERLSGFFEVLSPVFEEFLKEARASLAAHAQAVPDRPIHRVLGLGGGFALHGMLRCLRSGA